ncbi:MAG: hypothetical protein ACRCYS_12110 [Beijerinckiaceae bacterium]
MSDLVKRFRDDVAPRLLARFANGGVQSQTVTVTPNVDPLLPPGEVTVAASFNAAVSGVSGNILTSDPNLVATDLQAICAAVDYVPIVGGRVTVNGAVRLIVRVDAIPAAGEPAAYRFFLR